MEKLNTSHSMSCLRCGICCTRHQSIVSFEEAQRIASYLGITMHDWVKAYSDQKWPSDNNYLIRHVDSACIFLKYDKDMSYCDIQPCKPSCCADWIPSLEKKECRQGLSKYRKIVISHQRLAE